jgi:hypothetical protein
MTEHVIWDIGSLCAILAFLDLVVYEWFVERRRRHDRR